MAQIVKQPPTEEQIAQRVLERVNHPDALAELSLLARSLLSEELTREFVLQAYQRAALELRAMKREKEEDLVLDTMDRICGWCAPSQKI